MPDLVLNLVINEPLELNLSYMPFIKDGGLFVPTSESYALGDILIVNLQLPGKHDVLRIEGKVVWIIPKITLYNVVPGIGIQLTGSDAKSICNQIEEQLDPTSEVGGYSYGIIEDTKKK